MMTDPRLIRAFRDWCRTQRPQTIMVAIGYASLDSEDLRSTVESFARPPLNQKEDIRFRLEVIRQIARFLDESPF